jgi:hypothetical protein
MSIRNRILAGVLLCLVGFAACADGIQNPGGPGSSSTTTGVVYANSGFGLVVNQPSCPSNCQSAAQRIINGTALNAASLAAGNCKCLLMLPGGMIEYTATATDTGVNTGFQIDYRAAGVMGVAGFRETILIQFAANYPAITLGGMNTSACSIGSVYANFAVAMAVDQSANTSGVGVQFGCVVGAKIEMIDVESDLSGMGAFQPYIGLSTPNVNGIWFFENYVNQIWIRAGAHNLWSQQSNSSGNTWGVMYIGGTGNFYVVYQTPSSYMIDIQNHGEAMIEELNVEWTQNSGDTLMIIANVRNMVINQLRFEGDILTGLNPRLLNLALVNLVINRLDLYDVTIQAAGFGGVPITGTPSLITAFGDVHLFIAGGMWQWNAAADGNGAATTPFNFFGQISGAGLGASRSHIEAHNIYMAGQGLRTFSFDSTLPNSVTGDVNQFGKYVWNPGISRVEDPRISVPVSATTYTLYGWAIRPNVVVDWALTAPLTITWADTWGASGIGAALPTTAPDILELDRTAAATGAFNVLLKNQGGTTITTQAAANTINTITRSGNPPSAVTLTNF